MKLEEIAQVVENTIYRDAKNSCLDWCKYGKECAGDTTYNKHKTASQ